MTTTSFPTEPAIPPAPVPIRPLRFPTLIAVELRKMTDTRSGRWILASILGLVVFLLAWKLSQSELSVSFENYGGAVGNTIAFLVPVVGLLAMTSEWTQRTALTTFTLTPRRLPVIAAKYVAAIMLSTAMLAIGLVLTFAATALGGLLHGDASYADAGDVLRGFSVIVLAQVTMAAAFGALAAQTPVAILAFYVAPTAWAAAAEELLGDLAPWLDVFGAYSRLSSHEPFDELAKTLTAIAVWVVLPSVLGLLRSVRREVK